MSFLNHFVENSHCSVEFPIMLVVYLLLFSCSIPLHEAKLSYEYSNNTFFQICVSDILKKYFHKYKELSLVDMNTENDEIIKIVNCIKLNSIVLRKSDTRFRTQNDGYFIAAGSYIDFINNFPDLVKEQFWHPSVRFLIIIKDLTRSSLAKIFDLLMTYNVINVLVMDESADPELYTYNPFENYGCGQRYDRIIEYGKCTASQENLYPNKLVTGLRNCTFKVAHAHWPPYSIDPAQRQGSAGVEEILLREIGKLEHFQVELQYRDNAEEFTVIENDVVAVGPLYMLQTREVQMMLGGLILTNSRAKAFDYLWGHLAYTDEISYQVKTATAIAPWKYTYLEFDPIVWTVLLIAFVTFFLIFVTIVRAKDKGRIVLKMIASLFLAGNRIRGNFFTKYIFLHWVLFAYIINVYYVTNLVSFSTSPIMNYQVSKEEELVKYNMQPCVSRVIKDYLASVDVNESIWKNQRKGCENLLNSIKTVSTSQELYGVVLRSIYKYNQNSYVDEWGDSMIYTFNEPLTKTVYAIYLYKGFPMLDKLHKLMLRMRENGFVDKYLDLLYSERRTKCHFNKTKKRNNVIIPWYILICGYLLSVLVFFIEIIVKKCLSKRRPHYIG